MKIEEQHVPKRTAPFTAMSITSDTEREFALLVLAQDGTIVDAHDGCKESLGWSREDLAGRDIGEVIPAHRGLLVARILQSEDLRSQIGDDASFSMNISVQRMDETSFPARLLVRRFPETDCWTAAFFEAPPLVPPPPFKVPNATPATSDAVSQEEAEDEPLPWCDPQNLDHSGEAPGSAIALAEGIFDEPSVEGAEDRNDEEGFENAGATADEPAFVMEREADLSESDADPEGDSVETASKAPPETSAEPRPERSTETEGGREERRHLEQQITLLTSQFAALHRQLGSQLEEQTRTHKRIHALEEQLEDTRRSFTPADADLRKKSAEELAAVRELNKNLEDELARCKAATEAMQRLQSETESQLNAVKAELADSRESLARETVSRQELEGKLALEKQDRVEQERKFRLEISKLEAALKAKEVEIPGLRPAPSPKAKKSRSQD